MGRIDSYEIISGFTGNERIVVETDEGTRKALFSQIQDKINDCVDDKAEMLNLNSVSVTKDTEAEYILDITVGTTHIITPNLKGKAIKSVGVEAGHLIIYFSDDTSIDAGVVDGSIPTYGVRRDINSHSPTLKRVGDAVGLVANAGIGSEIVRNDFDNIYPWCAMRKCTLADDGTVTSYFGDANYVEDGSIGQVMVEIPKYYYAHYIDEPGAHEYWYISKEKINSKYRLPQPFIAKDGTELDKIYIGAYFAESEPNNPSAEYKATSISGNVYFGNTMSLASAITNAKNRGKNWHNIDILEWCDVIQPLFIIEFATLDSQSIMFGAPEGYDGGSAYVSANSCWGDRTDNVTEIVGNAFYSDDCDALVLGKEVIIETEEEYLTGQLDDTENNYAVRNIVGVEEIYDDDGVTLLGKKYTFDGDPIKISNNSEASINHYRCGITNKVKSSSGSTVGLKGQCDMVYRGLENIYGCIKCWAAGLLFDNNEIYVTKDISTYGKSINDYYKCNFELPDTGYISEMENVDFPWLYLPSKTDGASDSDYCDYMHIGTGAAIKGVAIGHGGGSTKKTYLQQGIFAMYFVVTTLSNAISGISRIAYRAYE